MSSWFRIWECLPSARHHHRQPFGHQRRGVFPLDFHRDALVDEEAAKNTPFGGTIAHGFLTLSLLSKMIEGNGVVPENIVMGLNYGFDKVRFLAPVRAGKRVRCHAEIASVDRKDDNRFLVNQKISVEIEGEDTPALVAEWLSMVVVG